jgi:hypothetical protein
VVPTSKNAALAGATENTMTSWIERAIFWQVYPLGFVGANPSIDAGSGITHRLNHLAGWLDYAVDLGASGVERIGVHSDGIAQRASNAMRGAAHRPQIEIRRDWYY